MTKIKVRVRQDKEEYSIKIYFDSFEELNKFISKNSFNKEFKNENIEV